MGEVLETGWLPSTPDGDNLLHSAVANMVARVRLVAGSVGATVHEDEDAVVVDTGLQSPFANPVVLTRPLTEAGGGRLAERLRDLLGEVQALVLSPWPTPDLGDLGFFLFGHPPFMLRPPGMGKPPSVDGIEVVEATDAATLAQVERTLVDGFPIEVPGGAPTGSILGPDHLGGPFRHFVGRVDGEPVATAAAMVSHGVVQVENVATLPDHRGVGYGEALTWSATLTDPSLPAVLIASDPGRPVYERMGYLPLFRWTLWGWAVSDDEG